MYIIIILLLCRLCCELDKITSNMGTIVSNSLETVAPIKLKKVREKRAAPWYNSYTHSLKKETRILERKWRKTNLEVFRISVLEKQYVQL